MCPLEVKPNCVCVIHMFIVSVRKAETRAEFAERTVAKLEKTIDDLEGTLRFSPSPLSCSDLHCFLTPPLSKSFVFFIFFFLFPLSLPGLCLWSATCRVFL